MTSSPENPRSIQIFELPFEYKIFKPTLEIKENFGFVCGPQYLLFLEERGGWCYSNLKHLSC